MANFATSSGMDANHHDLLEIPPVLWVGARPDGKFYNHRLDRVFTEQELADLRKQGIRVVIFGKREHEPHSES